MFLSKFSLVLVCVTQLLYGYSFTMHIDNTQPMVGEKVHLTLHFRYDNLEEYELEEPQYENFKITLVDENETQENTGTWLVTQHYTLIAKKSGSFALHPLKAHIEFIPLAYQDRYNKNHYLKKQDIFTQAVTMLVSPLPQNIQVTGDYTLQAHIDKNQTIQGSPVQFTLTLTGEGNIENLDFFSFHIPHTTIYEKNTSPQSKTFNILANRDYTIPPILLKYFNQKSKTVMLTSTPGYAIHITGNTSFHSLLWILVLILVSIGGYGLWILHRLAYLDTKKTFIKQLRGCKNKDDLLKKIAPHIQKDRQLTRLIYRLEECENGELKKIKKEIVQSVLKHSFIQL